MTHILVYIPDLPVSILGNDADEFVWDRIEANQRMSLEDVKCYIKLGIGVVRVNNQEDQNQLVSNVVSMVLDPKRNINISFVRELELQTYIVLDPKISQIPSDEEVARHLMQVYQLSCTAPTCKCISSQFPNIFRIRLKKLEDLGKLADAPDFRIENRFAIVYPYADCSFFEDLPVCVDNDEVKSAIATQIGESQLATSSFHIQVNKITGNAVVIASRSFKKWITEGHLAINAQNISKKAKLAYRVIVSPVSRTFNVNHIFRHRLFDDRVISHKLIDENLIVEVDSFDHFKECVDMGALRIDDVMMAIKPHAAVSDPDKSELDALNWYETAMLDMKPDILTVINNPKHPIFRYQWNAQNWIQQMRKAEASDGRSGKYDPTKHSLRVTVMLNTIGVLTKKKYVADGKEVILDLERMRTIGYDHRSRLASEKRILETQFKTPYPATTVRVINEDCLVLYEKLVTEGRRPVLLNMANATSPGGGYRKGDGAQEENIFRRSDYYQSLDGDIADRDRSERLHCTQKCEFKPMRGFGDFYPMEEFGAIYTSGITVFRYSEDKGYAYMKEPLYNVCAIAMAAYRNPPMTRKDTLEKKPAVNTHRKIQNIFAIAHHQKHDCLVLSALGCGAFKNPPKHVALLFKSVIYQYAGYFDTIYFAIIDDHNTGNAINPHGNFRPFAEILDGLVVEPPKILRVKGVTGPHRIVEKTTDGQLTLGDACICHLPPCQHAAICRDKNHLDHNQQFSHPPVCSLHDWNSKCDQMDDEVHMFTFIHIIKCKHGGECTSKDAAHLTEYDHPNFCKNEYYCNDTSPDHLFAFRHLPACDDGVDCSKYLNHDREHTKSYRHCKSRCPNDNCCVHFHDEKHLKNTIHSFREPCPFTPYNCSKYVEFVQKNRGVRPSKETEEHCLRYSHICPYGRQCRTRDDKHYETSIHIARQPCAEGTSCSKIDQEDHLESFSHPNIRDIRLFCREPGFKCPERYTSGHYRKYRHGQNHNYLNVAPSSNLNSEINFVENQKQLIRSVNSYVNDSNWRKAQISQEILDWIRALQPVHRCNSAIFESILIHGHAMSRAYMKLLNRPQHIAKAVMQHSRIRPIFLKYNSTVVKKDAYNLILSLVCTEFSKTGFDGITKLDPYHHEQINKATMRLEAAGVSQDDLKAIHDWTLEIAQASMVLHHAPKGIGYDIDKKMGTDKHVFGIPGLHFGYHYGEIIIVFKQEIMFHPDTNFSIQAATSFYSGRTYEKRPWIVDRGTEETRIKDFHHSKLHRSIPRCEYAAALELIAATGKDRQSMNIDLNTIRQRCMSVDSHNIFEAHLPQLIPLDYIESVYIPQNIYDSLSPKAQRSARAVFKQLVITPHTIDLSLIPPAPGAQIPLDWTRATYQNYVLTKIDEQILERMKRPRMSRGIIITVPSSRFEEHVVLPLTISQSYNLYRLDRPQAPSKPEYTYIYWKAMHGDMMLTIANRKLESDGKIQSNIRCLVCYVAKIPSTTAEHYQEEYSYLNDGHPLRHGINVADAKFRAKSDVFYRGCNTDDFLTFCLKISHRTGEVTLSHAGPNGIYNHEKISFRFDKSDLDLSRIDYVHVSGGEQDVPIRNLTINHEPVSELHPSFDKDFKIDTSVILGRYSEFANHEVHPPLNKDISKDREHPLPPLSPHMVRSSSAEPHPSIPPKQEERQNPELKPQPQTKLSLFKRLRRRLRGSCESIDESVSDVAQHNQQKCHLSQMDYKNFDCSIDKSSPSSLHRAGSLSPSRMRAESLKSKMDKLRAKPSTLPLCPDSIYCLHQYVKDHSHNNQYSHLCRFNELCQRQTTESNLIHQHHNASQCPNDKDCHERINPIHRAQYRHSGLSDFLIPCCYQNSCKDKSPEHHMKYFHGEKIPSFKSKFHSHSSTDIFAMIKSTRF